MKTQQLKKQLVLKKSTVSNLDEMDMVTLKGGLKTRPECPPMKTVEFNTCECTFYCSEMITYCPLAC